MSVPAYESSSNKSPRDGDKSIEHTTGWATDVDHGAETDLHRSLSTRHLTMIALGSSIGMGLWLGSGTSLHSGGPASIFIGYLLSGTMIWAVAHSIGEMAVMYPLPSAFIQWTSIFVDPAAGFALGWAYWFSFWITIANELQVWMRIRSLSQANRPRVWLRCWASGQTRCPPQHGSVSSGWSLSSSTSGRSSSSARSKSFLPQ